MRRLLVQPCTARTASRTSRISVPARRRAAKARPGPSPSQISHDTSAPLPPGGVNATRRDGEIEIYRSVRPDPPVRRRPPPARGVHARCTCGRPPPSTAPRAPAGTRAPARAARQRLRRRLRALRRPDDAGAGAGRGPARHRTSPPGRRCSCCARARAGRARGPGSHRRRDAARAGGRGQSRAACWPSPPWPWSSAILWCATILLTAWRARPHRPTPVPGRRRDACSSPPCAAPSRCPPRRAPSSPWCSATWCSRCSTTTTRRERKGAARPNSKASDPWKGIPRVNLLLLGSDAGKDRTGVRTDSMMVASINTKTGNTVLIGLPRSLQKVPFPESNPLHQDLAERLRLRQRVPAQRRVGPGRRPAQGPLPRQQQPGPDHDARRHQRDPGPAHRRLRHGRPARLPEPGRRHGWRRRQRAP